MTVPYLSALAPGTIVGWGFRLLVLYLAWVVARDAFLNSAMPRRTTVKAFGYVLALAGLAAVTAACHDEPDCEPDPVFGGCSSTCETTSLRDRTRVAATTAGLLAVPILVGAMMGIRRREKLRRLLTGFPTDTGAPAQDDLTWRDVRRAMVTTVVRALFALLIGIAALFSFGMAVARFGLWGFLIWGVGAPLLSVIFLPLIMPRDRHRRD